MKTREEIFNGKTDTPKSVRLTWLFSLLIFALVFTLPVIAQTTAFTYQGKLTDGGIPANAAYDMQFKLFTEPTAGSQVGPTVTVTGVQISAGIFTVQLDFGNIFSGTDRFLDISLSPTGQGNFTTLSPRQKLTSAPYSIQSLRATTADNSLKLGGTAADQFVQTSDSRLSDARIPLPGSSDYVHNSNTAQPGVNFSVGGIGTAGILNATTQFSIGGNRILSAAGTNNLFAGFYAGVSNTTGISNSFFGGSAGANNTTGSANSFYGLGSGNFNTTGGSNAFFGSSSGMNNESGNYNSYFGVNAGLANFAGSGNSYFGFSAGHMNVGEKNSFFGVSAGGGVVAGNTGSQNAFFGYEAGASSRADRNAFFGYASGRRNNTGFQNSFFGTEAGFGNTTGAFNSFFGEAAGAANTTGSNLTVIGANANVGVNNLGFATAIGAGAVVNSSNTLVLGRTADTVQVPGTLSVVGTFSTSIFNAATQFSLGGNRVLSNAGTNNLFVGTNAGADNTSGSSNTFVGASAGANTTAGSENAFFGDFAGLENTLGSVNSFFGTNAGRSTTTGTANSFFGRSAGIGNTTGNDNTSIGSGAGGNNTTGSRNTFLGSNTGSTSTTVQFNNSTAIGYGATVSASNSTSIGSGARVTTSNTIVLGTSAERTMVPGHFIMYGGDFGNAARTFDAGAGFTGLVAERLFWRRIGGFIPPSEVLACYNFVDLPGERAAGLTSCINNFGSSADKHEIKPFTGGLDIINSLNPVAFKRKGDGGSGVGLNADDVAEVAPQLVTRNDKGEVEGVKNGSLDSLFINAFKEQQKRIEAQQKQIDALKKIVCELKPATSICN